MKILPKWLREFVDLPVDDRRLAEDLTRVGIAAESVFEVEGETVFEMEITTNRVDAMNHYGVARECAAIYGAALRPIAPKLPAAKGKPDFKIEIEDPQGCARYTGRIIRGVKIAAAPAAMTRRLARLEQRPINNVADATNYVLWEMGQPIHAFDLDLLQGGKIVVRRARQGERLTTLDGVERVLDVEDLVIADGNRAVALAGLMGGADTMITEQTRNVLIEVAWFDPVVIRKMARRLGMHTDASHRFERGADFGAPPLASARVCELILESAGGTLEGELMDAVARQVERPTLELRQSEIRRHLGQAMPQEEVQRIFRGLGFGITPGRAVASSPASGPTGVGGARAAIAEEPESYAVAVPTWRLDVEQEIDLIEELARVRGYDSFPNTLPSFSGEVVEHPEAAKDRAVRGSLLAMGYHEAVALTFISAADARAFAAAPPVELENPLSEEAAVMRTSLVPGMLNMLAWNLNRGVDNVRLFEAGHVFALAGADIEERPSLCIGATGAALAGDVHGQARAYSFFDLKGDVEQVLEQFAYSNLSYDDRVDAEWLHPGRAARAVMDGATVVRFGQLHPQVAAARKLRQDVFVAEVFLDRLYQHRLHEPRYTRIPRFPAVERDFSFLLDDRVKWADVQGAVTGLKIAEMQRVAPVEIFRGGAVPAGRYSLLLRARFQSEERTLRDDEVNDWAQRIIAALQALGGTLRA